MEADIIHAEALGWVARTTPWQPVIRASNSRSGPVPSSGRARGGWLRTMGTSMPRRLVHLYQRKRIININLNVVAAGLLAIACTKGVIWTVDLFVDRNLHLLFTVVALVSDIIFDVAIYYALHWVANHWRPLKPRGIERADKPPAFFKDATLIQFERALLSPVYYVIAVVLMQTLQNVGWHPGWAMVGAFTSGLLVTRVMHTAMGLYTGSFRDFPLEPLRTPEEQVADPGADGAEIADPEAIVEAQAAEDAAAR